jgi:CubicO group peptidase (beta-lactamase class C family)
VTTNRPLEGVVDESLSWVVDVLSGHLDADPDHSFQAAAFHHGRPVLDVWAGPRLRRDSLMVPYSVSKNTIGFSIGLLLERAQIDLDERVAAYWPEFAAEGKSAVTVRQLLSHQAGLARATPPLTVDELLDHHAGAARLAASRPQWHPGSAFGYHAQTIGNLGDELVFRVTGRTLHEFYEEEIREPYGLEFHLGLPRELDDRRVPLRPMVRPPSVTDAPGWAPYSSALALQDADGFDYGNDERSWRFGHAAGSATASARGIAGLFAAAVTGLDGKPAFLSTDTVEQIGQQQVRGYDNVLGLDGRAHGIVFQHHSQQLDWGGPNSFGHDGAFGCVGTVDPDTGIAFGYVVGEAPWPGGADPRAIDLVRQLNRRVG